MSANKDPDRPNASPERQIVSAVPVPAMAGGGMFTDLPVVGGPLAAAPTSRPSLWLTAMKMKWMILGVFAVVSGAITMLVWLFMLPQYTANAEIRVRPIIPRLVYQTDENGRIPLYESFMNTQAAVVASPTVLQRVLDQPDVQATAWFKGIRKGPMGFMLADERPAIERLRESLKVRPRGQTEIIDVWMQSDWPQDSRTVVNAVLDQYMRFIREMSDQTRDVLYRKLLEQYRVLQADIASREKTLARLRKEYTTNASDEMVERERLRLEDLSGQLEQVQRDLAESLWKETQWEHLIDRGEHLVRATTTQPTALASNRVRYPNDEQWRENYLALKKAEQEVERQSVYLGDQHPRMIELRKRVTFAEDLLRDREKQLASQWGMLPDDPTKPPEAFTGVERELAVVRNETRRLQFQEKLLQEDLKRLRTAWEHTVDTASMLARQTREIRRKREMFEDVRQRKQQREMERNVPGSVEVLTRAFAPSKPSHDYRMLGTLAAMALGAAAGMGLAMVRTGRNQVIREVRELHHSFAAPFLGHLPLLERKHESSPDRSLLVNEGIRMVRTALMGRIEADEGNAVLITSAGKGEGKSTVAWLLGRSFARCSMRVLLVDADLRGRDASKRFGLDEAKGLIAALTDEADDVETIIETDLPHLNFLPAGRQSGKFDPEVIAGDRLGACMNRWREKFDVVLFDSPPVLAVADARILARQTDGTVLVVREDLSHRRAVADAVRYLDATAGAPLWGTVFIGGVRRLSYSYHSSPGV